MMNLKKIHFQGLWCLKTFSNAFGRGGLMKILSMMIDDSSDYDDGHGVRGWQIKN